MLITYWKDTFLDILILDILDILILDIPILDILIKQNILLNLIVSFYF